MTEDFFTSFLIFTQHHMITGVLEHTKCNTFSLQKKQTFIKLIIIIIDTQG